MSVFRLLTMHQLYADLCATSTTTTYPCPAENDGGGSCPDLPTGATCSGFVGNDPALLTLPSNLLLSARNQQDCLSWQPSGAAAGHCQYGAQRCNANVSTLELYDSFRTPNVGVCVTPVAAGSACTVGYGENLDLIWSAQEVVVHASRCSNGHHSFEGQQRVLQAMLRLNGSIHSCRSCQSCQVCVLFISTCTASSRLHVLLTELPVLPASR